LRENLAKRKAKKNLAPRSAALASLRLCEKNGEEKSEEKIIFIINPFDMNYIITEEVTHLEEPIPNYHTEISINELSTILVDIFYKIHVEYGPGLLESVYERIICYELSIKEIPFESQVGIPLVHKGQNMDLGFRADIIVDNRIIIEIKSVENIAPVHPKQLLTYLKISNKKLGLLVNFNSETIKAGITRIVNGL
jgi:GxxExxY protein